MPLGSPFYADVAKWKITFHADVPLEACSGVERGWSARNGLTFHAELPHNGLKGRLPWKVIFGFAQGGAQARPAPRWPAPRWPGRQACESPSMPSWQLFPGYFPARSWRAAATGAAAPWTGMSGMTKPSRAALKRSSLAVSPFASHSAIMIRAFS